MVYAATLSEYKIVMRWQIIIEEFGPNIYHIAWFYNIVTDTLIIFPYTPSNKYKNSTVKD